ncbi:monocarboxylate transporter 7 isoform X2 [Bacillus rossius redtenbacheri]|uniref:monocarboxylate transporter 7 isoform X2 n=1 Tax=Bacillus rossius redtenbacheri TaxID=93214 RepID=UPI002FDCE8FF
MRSRPPSYVRVQTESECSYSEREENARLTAAGAQDGDGCSAAGADDECLSYCEYHDIPPPPDGGYGWVIVFASFMCNMILDGIAYTFGVFLGEFVVAFGEGKGRVAWVGSLLSGMYLSAGPVVSALTNKYGCRPVCIAGSVLACAGFVLSTLSPDINVLMITYGIMGGVGFGLIYLPAVVCVGYYFETKRSLATGIAVCGSGVGTFAFAPLATMLLDNFGWRGANIILAGLILNCAVFGALMRPLEFPKVSKCKPLLQRMAEEKRLQMERGSIGGSYFMVQLPDGTMERRMKMPINFDPGVHSSFNLDQMVPGTPLTPVPTVATLPTICEVKVPENSGSSGASSAGSGDLKKEGRRIEDLKEEEDKKKSDSEKEKGNREDKEKDEHEERERKLNKENSEFTNRSNIPRNASQPAFTTHVQGLPKNGSVPFFDRIRKTSAGERFRPTLDAIKVSRSNVNSNGDIRKSMHLRLSTSSYIGGSRNNNEMWSKTDMGDNESVMYNSKTSIPRERREMVRPMSRKDIFYSGSVMNLPEYKSQKSLSSYRQSIVSLPRYAQERSDLPDVERGSGCCPCFALPESFRSTLATMMDMSLLKDPVFMLISISNLFGMMGLYVPFFYLVDAAIKDGIDPSAASFLLSIIGITNTIGRVVCGYIADFPWMDSLLLNNICLLLSTVAVASTPFCTTYTTYMIMAIFFGIAISGYISLTSIILVDLLGLDKLTNAFGLLILFRGAAAIVGTPLAGAVFDATQSYSLSFLIAGLFFLVSTATSFMAPGVKRCMAPASPPPLPDALAPIDEDEEEDQGAVPEIVETGASPMGSAVRQPQEIKQIESVL